MRLTTTTLSFGVLLKQLRKQAGMTQRDLAAALNYSDSLISSLEKEQRLPDLTFVVEQLIPALGLQDDPKTAAWLIECAAAARGESPPASLTLQRTARLVLHEEQREQTTRLPAPPTPLLGRSEEVTHLCHRLLAHHGRLLALVGPPGIGKTRLALAMAERLQPHYADGVVFVPLAAINDAATMTVTVLATVGGSEASANSPQKQLIAFLRRKAMLLVLDNLEQIGDAAAVIADLLAECPGVVILATSRERLHLRAEQRYKVPPLNLAFAVDLFIERAQAIDPDFRLTPYNQSTIEALCQRLDRLPLAIELCAAQIELFSPQQLLAELQAHPLDLLVDGTYDLPPQQRTLRRAIQRSYQLLNEAERTLLRSLSIFSGGFALPEVERVSLYQQETQTRSLLTMLQALLHKSLVRSETIATGEQRFFLLETIREFALEQARSQGEENVLRQRHFAAYLQFARTVDHKVRGAEAVIWFDRLSQEHDNLRAAWHWAITSQQVVDAAWLGVALCHSWNAHAIWNEGAQWLEQLLSHRHQLAPDLRLALLLTLYRFWRALHNFQAIEQYGGELIHLRDTCPAKLLQAAAWFYLANSASNPRQSLAAFDICLALLQAPPDTLHLPEDFCFFADRSHLHAMTLMRYAVRLIDEVGEYERAEQLSHASLRLFQQMENRDFVAYAIGNLGRLALVRGDIAQAHQHLQEAVALATVVGNLMSLIDWQFRLAIVTLYRGDASGARRLLNECLDRCLPLGNMEYLARIYGYLAEVALYEAKVAEAEAWLIQSTAYQPKLRWLTIELADFLYVCARLATAQQHYVEAAQRFGLAEQVAQRIGYRGLGPMRPQIEAAMLTLQAALEPAVFAEAFAVGQQMALAEAFTTILAPTPSPSVPISPFHR